MHNIQLRTGQIIGLDHVLRQANCQDSHATIQTDTHIVGIVCDGCSEGAHSEVGATLTAEYAARTASQLLTDGVPLAEIPAGLHAHLLTFLDDLLRVIKPGHPVEFIRQHLLFTLVGVIATQQGCVTFAAGDGLIACDEQVHAIDQHNEPTYLAYHLIKGHLARGFRLPDGFDVCELPSSWQRLAIASDGFLPELLPQVWGLAHPRGLQRKMNFWANQERCFRDDATLITLERLKDDTGHSQ